MSELAWSLTDSTSPSSSGKQTTPRGLAYAATSQAALRESVAAGLELTRPTRSDARFSAMKETLDRELRIRDDNAAELIATVLLDELAAPASRGAKRTSATPLTIETALLQDRRGVTGKKNPANIARILEQLYALGGGEGTVATGWQAALVNAGTSGLPRWGALAFETIVPSSSIDLAKKLASGTLDANGPVERRPAWLGTSRPSPYRWFARSWYRLCHGGWIEAMPRRRWTDWASCVARTAIATGFLFEMHVARRLAAALLASDDSAKAVEDILGDGLALLPWNDQLPLSTSDVGPVINRLAGAGTACLDLIEQLTKAEGGMSEAIKIDPIEEHDRARNGLAGWLANARSQVAGETDIAEAVTEALSSGVVGGARNTRETIRYSLLDRGTDGGTDLYALLRRSGKFTRVEPGQEWLVTVASLCADGPGGLARLGDLRNSLAELGIQASTPTIISLLEKYGMARSSHDADDALEIQAGF
ncbi:hypothetical protein [Tropicimonas sediminicola]|nr:hypothetical protein [Tropicimonas sediminicola]